MGVIIRQGFKTTFASYLGMALGMVNTIFLYPKFLEQAEYGLIRVLLDTSAFLLSIAMLGGPTVLNYFFPRYYNHERKHSGFLFFMLAYPTFGYVLFTGLFFALQDVYLAEFQDTSPLLVKYYYYMPVIICFMMYMTVLDGYSRAHQRAFVPALVRELGVKIGNAVAVLLYAYGFIDFNWFLNLLAGAYLAGFFVLGWYLRREGWLYLRPNWKLFNRKVVRETGQYGTITLLGALGSILAFRIDTIMLPAYLDLASVAVFGVALSMTRLLEFPRAALSQVAIPVLAKAVAANNRAEIDSLNRKSGVSMLLITTLLGVLLWANIDDFFILVPKSDVFRAGKWLVLIFIISRVLDNFTGLSIEIILYSKLYHFYLYLTLVLAGVNVALNILLIPMYGLEGAALATLGAIVVDMALRLLLVWHAFASHPFVPGMAGIFGLGGMVYALSMLLHLDFDSKLATIAEVCVRSGILAAVFVAVAYKLNLSPDFNRLLHSLWRRVPLRRG